MDTVRIEATPQECAEGFRRWSKGLGKLDHARAVAYRLLNRGAHLIDLSQTMTKAGLDGRHLPRLAIARSVADRVSFQPQGNREDSFVFQSSLDGEFIVDRRNEVVLNRGSLPGLTRTKWAESVVPAVPPELRPKRGLRPYWTLFEADWKDVTKDPILLRHIAGAIYHVVAAWDLTPLERSVLRGL